MNKIEIGHTAGKVWRLLEGEGDLPVNEVQKKLDLPEPLLYLALGWLCREDKIHCYEKDGKYLLSMRIPSRFFG